jgi:hypothetical protein
MNGEKTHARVRMRGSSRRILRTAAVSASKHDLVTSASGLPQDALEFLVHDIAHMGARSPHTFNS